MKPARVSEPVGRGDARGSLRPCMHGRAAVEMSGAVGLRLRWQAACRTIHLGIIARSGEVPASA